MVCVGLADNYLEAEGARALRISTPRPGSTGTESVDEVMLDMPSPLGIGKFGSYIWYQSNISVFVVTFN